MFFPIVAGLIALLAALLLVRSAQRHGDPVRDVAAGDTVNTSSSSNGHASSPPSGARPEIASRSAEYDHYLWESRRLARRGETRAANLDFFGYLISGLTALVAVGAFITVARETEAASTEAKVAITLGACGTILALIAVAAMFFGFGALVRNSSRSLAISAGDALDSFDPPEPCEAGADDVTRHDEVYG